MEDRRVDSGLSQQMHEWMDQPLGADLSIHEMLYNSCSVHVVSRG